MGTASDALLPEEQRILEDMTAAWEDIRHPQWHLTTPSHFMIDCWGAVFHKDWYHMFVDVNPECGEPGERSIFWHVRSKDLLHWEHLPIPMMPDSQEVRTNDGWIGFDGNNDPVLLYTSVPKPPENRRTHRAAIGDQDFLHFERVPGEPFMTLENHGGPAFYGGWSDPYVFEVNGKKYLTISKCVEPGGDPLPVYEAADDSLQRWNYRGVLFEHNGEVVNFFPLGGKWVLIYSPYRAIEVFVGTLDAGTLRFTPERHEILSYGYHSQSSPCDRGFYATCVYRQQNRTVLCGWISGFHASDLWDGCMGVPRELALSEDMRIIQKPITELLSLRDPDFSMEITADTRIPFPETADMELVCVFRDDNGYLSLTVGEQFSLTLTSGKIVCCKDEYPIGYSEIHARLLFDKVLCELFFGGSEALCGTESATCCFSYPGEDSKLSIRSEGVTFKLICHKIKAAPQTISELLKNKHIGV